MYAPSIFKPTCCPLVREYLNRRMSIDFITMTLTFTASQTGETLTGYYAAVTIDGVQGTHDMANFYLRAGSGQLLSASRGTLPVGSATIKDASGSYITNPFAGVPFVQTARGGQAQFYFKAPSAGSFSITITGVPWDSVNSGVTPNGYLILSEQVTRSVNVTLMAETCYDVSPMFTMNHPGTEVDSVVPITVTFTYSGYNADAPGVTFTWNFGDGATGTGKSVTHTYNVASPNNGAQPYIPKLTTYNPCNSQTKGPFDQGFRIYARPTGYIPPPVTICNPPGSCAPGSVTCVNGVSYVCGSDGCFTPGGNACGVTPPPGVTPPTANFYADAVSGVAPLTVNFIDTSTGSPTSRRWDFGDGATDVSASPTHTFVNSGNYNVTLTATNAGGSTSKTVLITVSGETGYVPPPGGIQLPAWLNAQNALIAAILLGGAGVGILVLKRRKE